MNGIQRPKDGCGGERRSHVEQIAIEIDLIDPGQLPSRMRDRERATGTDGTDDLHACECARNTPIGAVSAKELPKSLRLGFLFDEFDEGRGVQIEPHDSCSRIAASVVDASTS